MDEAGYVGEVVVLAVASDSGSAEELVEDFGRNFLRPELL